MTKTSLNMNIVQGADYWLKNMSQFFSCRKNFNEGLFHCLTRLKIANQDEGVEIM